VIIYKICNSLINNMIGDGDTDMIINHVGAPMQHVMIAALILLTKLPPPLRQNGESLGPQCASSAALTAGGLVFGTGIANRICSAKITAQAALS
jgi:hypothetical protein